MLAGLQFSRCCVACAVWALFAYLTAGCSGTAVKGKLTYPKYLTPGAAESVWVRVSGSDSCGATIPVKKDHTWSYNEKGGGGVRFWSRGCHPLLRGGAGMEEPVLVFQAFGDGYNSQTTEVRYSTHRKTPIVLPCERGIVPPVIDMDTVEIDLPGAPK